METLKNDVILRKEGIYWTLYIGDEQQGCGFLEDMLEQAAEAASEIDKSTT